MITSGLLNIISLIYGVLAIRTAYLVWRGWRKLFDDEVTPEDIKLANSIAFYFLWPPIVLLHEGGHALVASLFGAHGIQLHFFGYWGEITYPPTLTARQDWWVALAGNAVNFLMGIVLALAARYAPVSLIWRIILSFTASNQWFVVMFWYPMLCITGSFQGDFTVIYGHQWWWAGSVVVGVVNAICLVIYVWTTYYDSGKAWVYKNLWRAEAVVPSAAPPQ